MKKIKLHDRKYEMEKQHYLNYSYLYSRFGY